MTEPLGDVDLSELDAIAAPRDEKEPFLHSVTRQTPWCLYSLMFHVLVVVVIAMVPIMADTESDREEVLVLIDPGPPTETELLGGSTRTVPIGVVSPRETAPDSWPVPMKPVDVPPDTCAHAPDLFDPSDHIVEEDDQSPPAYRFLMQTADESHLPSQGDCPGPISISLSDRIWLIFHANLSTLHSRVPGQIGRAASW